LVPGSDTLLLLGGFPQISVTARIVFYQVCWKEVMISYKIHIGFELEVFFCDFFPQISGMAQIVSSRLRQKEMLSSYKVKNWC
jgi:hypothetical protein